MKRRETLRLAAYLSAYTSIFSLYPLPYTVFEAVTPTPIPRKPLPKQSAIMPMTVMPMTVMPLGDSKVFGVSGLESPTAYGGWRGYLIYNFQINDLSLFAVGRMRTSWFIGGCEAHPGQRISEVDVDEMMAFTPNPSLIIVDIGLVDLIVGSPSERASACTRLGDLLVSILRKSPASWLIVHNLMPYATQGATGQGWINDFNAQFPAMLQSVRDRSHSGRIRSFDMASKVTVPMLSADLAHPLDSTYALMAGWLMFPVLDIMTGVDTGRVATF